jgi:hypothetical protein
VPRRTVRRAVRRQRSAEEVRSILGALSRRNFIPSTC